MIKRNNKGQFIKGSVTILSSEEKNKIRSSKLGAKNPMWKGNKVGYLSLHEWIKNHKKRVVICERCKKNKVYDLANISGKYKRDIDDYEWLCRSCHMEVDGRINNLDRTGCKSWCTGLTREIDLRLALKAKKSEGHPNHYFGKHICAFCHKSMQNYIPVKGKFKGQVQKYSWVCPCHPNLVVSIG